jgi:transcription termination/antitermination protein NusG
MTTIATETEAKPWYAVQTRPRYEVTSAAFLMDKGYEVFYPTRRMKGSGDRPVFPSYLFCRSTTTSLGLIVTTPGVLKLLGRPGKPESVPDVEIAHVRRLIDSGLSVEGGSGFTPGTRVRIRCGPLSGVEGVIVGDAGRQRLTVSVYLLQRFVSVALDPLWLERPAETASEPGKDIKYFREVNDARRIPCINVAHRPE